MNEVIRGVIIGVVTAGVIGLFSLFNGEWIIEFLGGVSESEYSELVKKNSELEQGLEKLNLRVSGISLTAVHQESREFACGGGAKADSDSLIVMYGSRDGTGCRVTNLNHFKKLQLSVPE